MTLDDRIQQHANELRTSYAHRVPEPPELRPRHNGILVAIAVAVVAVVLIAPLALLRGSGDSPTPTSTVGIPPATAVTPLPTSIPPPPLPARISDGASLSDDPLLLIGDGRPRGVITTIGDIVIVSGAELGHVSQDAGDTWTETAPLPNDDLLGPIAGTENLIAAIGTGNATARLYISHDLGNNWELVELPVADDIVEVVPDFVAELDGALVVTGAATRASFTDDVQLYVWRSADGAEWSRTLVADMGTELASTSRIIDGPDGLILLAAAGRDRLLAFREAPLEWRIDELRSVLATQASIGPTMTNAFLVDSRVVGNEVFVWWAFRDGLGAQGGLDGALMRYTADFGWEARPLAGAIPEAMAPAGGGYVGIRFPDPASFTPTLSSAIVVSADGTVWREVARFLYVDLASLIAISDLEYLVAGNVTEALETGGAASTDAGVWRVILADTAEALAGRDEPGG